MAQSKASLFKYATRFLGITVLGSGLGAVANIALGRILGPADYGIYAFCFLVIVWGKHIHFGLYNAFGKQYPLERGAENHDRAEAIADSSFWGGQGAALVLSTLLIGICLLPGLGIPVFYRWGIGLMAVQNIVEVYPNFAMMKLRCDGNFVAVERLLLIRRAIDTVGRVLLAWLFGIVGLFFGSLLGAVGLAVAVPFMGEGSRFGRRFEMRTAWEMLVLGFPLLAVAMIAVLYESLGRPLMLGLYDETELGYFAMGALFAGLATLIPQSAGFVLAPTMMQEYGRTGELETLAKYALKPTQLLCVALLVLILWSSVGIDFMLTWVLPRFEPGVLVGQILMFGVYFRAMQRMFGQYLSAIDDRMSMFVVQGLSLLVAVACALVFWSIGLGGEGVAAAFMVGNLVYAVWNVSYCLWRYVGYTVPKIGGYLFELLLPIGLGGVVLYLAASVWACEGVSLSADLVAMAIQVVVVSTIFVPLGLWFERRHRVISEVIGMVRQRAS